MSSFSSFAIPTSRLPGLLLAGALLLGAGGCTNPKTPAGHEGYVYHVPLVVGEAKYRESLKGPASTGASWRLYVINIDMRMRSYKEDFRLLTKDNLSVSFEVNTRIGLRPGTVKEIVEDWGGKKWYKWNVKEPLRTTVRRSVTQVSAIAIQLKTNAVRQRIHERLVAKYKGTPIRIDSVDIGNIQFPGQVTKAIEKKIGQQQELERQKYLLAKTRKEAAIRVLEALKAAKQQIIISSTLDPLYIQRKAVQVYRTLAESPNKTVLVLPNTSNGTGLPLVLSSDVRKKLSAEDRKLLKNMEERYMRQAREATIKTGKSITPDDSGAKGDEGGKGDKGDKGDKGGRGDKEAKGEKGAEGGKTDSGDEAETGSTSGSEPSKGQGGASKPAGAPTPGMTGARPAPAGAGKAPAARAARPRVMGAPRPAGSMAQP
jgi:regulator of protease activity HflC (stomatin/prohibitin superfamily)